jgi:uncharacterized protein YgbK (DUF1537 family)
MTPVLIIADDLSGAADCGIACSCHGLETLVHLERANAASAQPPNLSGVDVVAVDTDTRSLPHREAAAVVADIVRRYDRDLNQDEPCLLFKKIDSTLRGPFGAELAAALLARRAAWPQLSRIVVLLAPAFPAQGRTTLHARQLVHGQPIESTEFSQAETGTQQSDMAAALRAAGLASVAIDLASVRAGNGLLQHSLLQASQRADVLICDAETDLDLASIASAASILGRQLIWAGSAGLAHHLHRVAGFPRARSPQPQPDLQAASPILFVIGSISSVTREQSRLLASEPGLVSVPLAPELLLSAEENSPAWQEKQSSIWTALHAGQDVLVQLDSTPIEESRQLTRNLARLLEPCAAIAGALVASGGETARAVLDAWGIRRLRLHSEIETGFPCSLPEGWSRSIPILTKAGGFGDPGALLRCRQFLRPSPATTSSSYPVAVQGETT